MSLQESVNNSDTYLPKCRINAVVTTAALLKMVAPSIISANSSKASLGKHMVNRAEQHNWQIIVRHLSSNSIALKY